MGLFSFGTTRRVVVTFSDTALRAVTVETKKHGSMRIVRSVEQQIPSGMIAGGVVEQPELFGEFLRSFGKKLSTKHVHVLVPQEVALIVPLPRPDTDDADVRHHVRNQLENLLAEHPGPKDGYEVLSIVDDGDAVYIDTISVSLLDNYRTIFKKAGFHVVSWDTPHPDWAESEDHQEQSHIMVGVGERSTNVVFLNGGVPVMKRVVPVGHADLVDVVRDMLNIQTHEAQKIISRYGVGLEHKEEKVLRALYDALRPLEVTINTMIDDWKQRPYKTVRQRYPIASLLLHGNAYALHGFHDRMSHVTRIPAHHLNVAETLNIPDVARIMTRDEIARFAPLLWKAHELVKA